MIRKLKIPQHIIDETIALQEALEQESTAVLQEYGIKLEAPRHNSEIALANALVKCLLKAAPHVSTQGTLWYYDAATGIWIPYDKEALLSIIDGFDGLKLGKNAIKLTNQKTNGIYAATLRHRDIRDPLFFNAAPCGIQCINEFLGLKDGIITVQQTSPDSRARHKVEYTYSTHTPTKTWVNFLHKELFRDDDDYAEKANLLAEFFGLALLGKSTQFAKALILTGAGANGKSTILDLMAELFPSYGQTAVAPQNWSKEYYLASLQSSILNCCNEVPATEIVGSDVFKAVITGEEVTARQPYVQPFSFAPRAGHVFACNKLPYVNDNSHGFWRRFLIVPFNRDFSKNGKTKEAVLRELRPLLGQIFVWAIKGAQRALDTSGYTIPSSHTESLKNWQLLANPVAYWAKETGLISGGKGLPCSTLYAHYREWARENGYKNMTLSTFRERMTGIGFTRQRKGNGHVFKCTYSTDIKKAKT